MEYPHLVEELWLIEVAGRASPTQVGSPTMNTDLKTASLHIKLKLQVFSDSNTREVPGEASVLARHKLVLADLLSLGRLLVLTSACLSWRQLGCGSRDLCLVSAWATVAMQR